MMQAADSLGTVKQSSVGGFYSALSIRHKLLTLLLIAAAAGLSFVLSTMAQMLTVTNILVALFAIGIWMVYSLFFGFDVRAASIWMLLYLIKPVPLTFYGLLMSLVLYLVVQYYSGERKRWILPYPLAMAVLLAASIQGLIRAAVFEHAADYFGSTALVPLFVLLLFANSELDMADLRLWLKVAVVISAILGIIGVIMGVMNPEARLGSLWITAMTINGFYTITFFFAIGLALDAAQQVHKWFWAACAALIFLGMMYTYTRVALVAVVFGLGILMWRIKRFRLVGLFTLALVPLAIPASMVTRFQAGFALDESLFIRFVAWYYSIQQIIRYPLFGMGISTWQSWYVDIVPIKMLYAVHSHNLFLKIWVEIGIFGLVSYFYIIFAIIIRYWKACVRHREANLDYLVLLASLALLFSCLTDIFIQQHSVAVIFWCTMGFMILRSRAAAKGIQ